MDCLQSNMQSHKAYKGSTSKYKVEKPFYKVHADLCIIQNGKGKSYGNTTRNLLVMVDDFTKFVHIDFPSKKNETGKKIANFIAYIQQFFEKRVKLLSTDKGNEFTGGESLEIILKNGIRLCTTSGYSSKSNGIVEKLNQDLLRKVRPMLLASKLTLDFWEYACMHTVEIMNRRPFEHLDYKSSLYYLMNSIGAEQEVIDIPPYVW